MAVKQVPFLSLPMFLLRIVVLNNWVVNEEEFPSGLAVTLLSFKPEGVLHFIRCVVHVFKVVLNCHKGEVVRHHPSLTY